MIHAVEAIENVWQVGLRDAATGVGDLYLNRVSLPDRGHGDRATGGGVSESVRHQIAQRPLEERSIQIRNYAVRAA